LLQLDDGIRKSAHHEERAVRGKTRVSRGTTSRGDDSGRAGESQVFAVAEAHDIQTAGDDDGYAFIEKVGLAGQIAEEENPRK
jgi:hypothetical protein